MDRITMTDEEMSRAEAYAADEAAEQMYQEMIDQEMSLAELAADSIAAERAYNAIQA